MSDSSESLVLKFARKSVENYKYEDDVIRQHFEAMECHDCEAFLQLGIDAFHWLIRADRVIRQAVYDEVQDYDRDLEQVLESLFKVWLEPCEFAQNWAHIQESKGFKVSNFDRFKQCCDEAKAIVSFLEQHDTQSSMALPLIKLRDQALQEFHDGETAEFL